MPHALSIRGVNGSVRWSYHTAAVLQGWSVTPNPDKKTFTLKATMATSDAFKLTQRPLVFVAPLNGGAWELDITDVKTIGTALTATLAVRTPEKETP